MHWLKNFRKEYPRKDGGKGISRAELARMVRDRDTGCSDVLIAILESGGITHPGIAQKIAKVTGCTTEQYNTMINKIHHGGWEPGKPKKRSEINITNMPQPMTPGILPNTAREVIALERDGRERGRYNSVARAARVHGCSDWVVESRCLRRTRRNADEFQFLGITFRRADEWDAMTPEQRHKDLVRTQQTAGGLCGG